MKRLHLMAAVAALAGLALMAQDNDPDRAVSGGLPAGWSVRPDRGAASGDKMTESGGVFHFVMGPAGTFYRSDWTKSGDYTFSARLTQLMAPSHPISYGLFIGGSNMGPSPTYTYFLVRNQGQFFIANWEGAGPTTVVPWTNNPAIVKQGADGRQQNTLEIQTKGDNVVFMINGKEMTSLPKSKVHADGSYGFRIGHNLDVDVDQVKRP